MVLLEQKMYVLCAPSLVSYPGSKEGEGRLETSHVGAWEDLILRLGGGGIAKYLVEGSLTNSLSSCCLNLVARLLLPY